MGTIIEADDSRELFDAAHAAHEAVDADRVETFLKVDDKRTVDQSAAEKVDAVEDVLGRAARSERTGSTSRRNKAANRPGARPTESDVLQGRRADVMPTTVELVAGILGIVVGLAWAVWPTRMRDLQAKYLYLGMAETNDEQSATEVLIGRVTGVALAVLGPVPFSVSFPDGSVPDVSTRERSPATANSIKGRPAESPVWRVSIGWRPTVDDEAIDFADELTIGVHQQEGDAAVPDFGVEVPGAVEAGLLLAEIQTSGLATVQTAMDEVDGAPLTHVELSTDHPALGLLCSQKSGWELSVDDFEGLGSGPARALVAEEEEFNRVGYHDASDFAVLVVESEELPDQSVAAHVAERTGVPESAVFLPTFSTASVTGSVVTAARAAELATFRLSELGYDPIEILSVTGKAPVAPVAGDEEAAIARTTDAPSTARRSTSPSRRRVRPLRGDYLHRGRGVRDPARRDVRRRRLGLRGGPRRRVRARPGHRRRPRRRDVRLRRHARGDSGRELRG